MSPKYVIWFLLTFFFYQYASSQVVVCAGSPCTSNDFTIDNFYLGDEFGNPFGPGYCEPGTTVNAHLWINFTANSAAARYDLYLHFSLYVDGVFIGDVDECYFDNEPIPINVSLDTYQFSWDCGAEIVLQNLYMGWQTTGTGTCHCSQSHCYSEPEVIVEAPLIANFEFDPSCLTSFTIDFTSTTSGGTPPYFYFWDFGDGTTSTLANPTHTYATTGPYTVTLSIIDAVNTDSYGFEIVQFNSNIPPEITPPVDINIIGCDINDFAPLIYSETAVPITEIELNVLGGSVLLGNPLVSLSYIDSSTGTCPLIVTRTFTIIDSCDNTDIEVQTITIEDNVLPTASNPASINVLCAADVPAPDTNVIIDEADNCSIPTVTFVSDISNSQSCPETITRTYSVTDACNNSINVTQTIVVNDDVLPTATNPATINVQCVADVPAPDVNVVTDEADNCSIPTVAFVSEVSDNQGCPGTVIRTYSVTDACNNSIEVTQLILVTDNILPIASNPLTINVQCVADIPAPDVNVVTDEADNCAIPTVAFVSDVSDNQSCPETITRTYSVTDACNNSINVTQTIVVNDDVLPTASNPATINVLCFADVPAPDINVVTDEADNCSVPVVAFVSDVSDNQSCPETITRTYSVTDACNNSINVTQTIVVNDDVLPTASNPATINVLCFADVPAPDTNVVTDEADNCSVPVVAFVSDVSDNQSCPETIIRTYSVTDACNNAINVTQTIVVNDDVLPTASNPATINVICIADIPAPDANVVTDETDNCSIPTVTFVSEVSDNQSCPETITRTYSVTDACNNSINVTQTIVVNDDVLPTASNPVTINVQCIADVPAPDVTVVTDEADNCSIPTVAFVSEVSDNQGCPGTVIRTYSVTDACNNSIEVTQLILVTDNILPTASNPLTINVQCVADVPAPDVNVVTDEADNCAIPTVAFVSDVSDNQSCPETITRTYSVTDACDNSINVTQTIVVNDDVLPTASNPSSISIQCIADVPAPDVNVVTDEADNCSIPTVAFISDISDNQSCPETITRTYSVTDACNNSINVTQIIMINDDILPTASNPPTIIVQCIEDVPVADINIVTDEADNCSIPTVEFVSDVSDNQICPQTIIRTYSVTDACNNSINVTQTIIVDDDILPTASNPPTINVQCIEDVPSPDVNVVTDEADNCSIPTVVFVSDVSNNRTCPEIITRTYSVTDACNNSIIVSQLIFVNDDVLPTASNPAAINVQCIEDVPSPDINVVIDEADNCSVPTVAFVSDVSDNRTCPEIITRTYSVTDACNNSIDVTQLIFVSDDVLPTASNPTSINVQCIEDVPNPDVNVVTDETDNCSTPTVAFVSDVSDNQSCPETITRTYSVTDACNNSINVTQAIVINDDVLPTASNPATINIQCINGVPNPDVNVVTDEADNCSIPTVAFVSDVSDNQSCPETITRTYSVTDACNNSINVIQSIVINDDELPTASDPASINVECIEDLPVPNVSVVIDEADNCSTPTVAFVSDVSDNQSCPETIIRTYSVTDACDNSINVTQMIKVNDDVLPTASNPPAVSLICSENLPAPDINVVSDAADNCSTPTVAFVSDVSDNLSCPETITRTYSVTDACDNSINVTQLFIVNDDILPSASNPPTIYFECTDDIPIPDINVVTDEADNCSIPIVAFVSDVSDNQICPETITRTYSITDACNNSINVTQYIIVNDDVAPILTSNLNSVVNVSCEGIPEIPTLEFIDNCSPSLSVDFTEDTEIIDDYSFDVIRNWIVSDDCNNQNTYTQTVHVSRVFEVDEKLLNICVGDEPIDLNSFITNTTSLDGEWESQTAFLLDGSSFTPSETEIGGNYEFTYTYSENDCIWTTIIGITMNDDCVYYPCVESFDKVNISKMVTPDNDGQNDFFEVTFELNEQSNEICDVYVNVELFNRWGVQVYKRSNYDNDWSGTSTSSSFGSSGDLLPTGTYYYIVTLLNSGLDPIQGYILLGTD